MKAKTRQSEEGSSPALVELRAAAVAWARESHTRAANDLDSWFMPFERRLRRAAVAYAESVRPAAPDVSPKFLGS